MKKNMTIEELNSVFDKGKFKEIYIDTYSNNPYMLYSRSFDKNASSMLENGRLIIRRNDDHHTAIMNIVLNNIDDFLVSKCGEQNRELLIKIHNICFKILTIF